LEPRENAPPVKEEGEDRKCQDITPATEECIGGEEEAGEEKTRLQKKEVRPEMQSRLCHEDGALAGYDKF
jgi:hypothetical protein